MLWIAVLLALAQSAPPARDADSWHRSAVERMRQGRLDEAAAASEHAVRMDPRQPLYHLGLAEIRLRAGDRKRAVAAAAQAAQRAGDDVRLWRAIAGLHARAADGIGQAKALQQVLRLTPEDKAAHIALAELLLEHRTADGSVAVATAALERFPNDAALLRLRALADYAMGRKPEAIRGFIAAIDAAPEDPAGYASLETLLPEAGDLMPEITTRLQSFVTGAGAVNPISHFLLALTAPEEAEKHLRNAIAADTSFWPAHYRLGLLLRDNGEKDGAIASLRDTLRLNPKHAESHYALALLVPDRSEARRHREQHHVLRAEAVKAEQVRTAERPRINVQVQ